MFESIDVKLGINDTKVYGDAATLQNSDKTEFLKAKDGVKFCAGERCFIGVEELPCLEEVCFWRS